MNYRELLKDKKRVVIKVGSSSLIHKETGRLDLRKLEVLVREISDLHNQGKDVVLVTSGAVAVGSAALGLNERPRELKVKQACSAVGQARLMMIYQKLFAEYNDKKYHGHQSDPNACPTYLCGASDTEYHSCGQ